MLVLSRKANESILIGDDIKITLLNIDAERVKIGIEAPKNLRVFRYETLKKVVLENQAAVHVNVNLVELAGLKEHAQKEKK
ncbi:carbon storage regulator CsrA [Christensenella intestinihominis]|uniref:carbon storage regulator CsrA n=1 Tax=Christensenella intestinihominis TaxID=1851429 RepID=UPI00082E9FE5|nr:carbon storage regulator CsrA [Christensenella intestinihominis]